MGVDISTPPAIPHGTYYYSLSGADFVASSPRLDSFICYGDFSYFNAGTITVLAPIHLPHGAIVTGVIIYGSLGAQAFEWKLYHTPIDASGKTLMAKAYVNSGDTTINDATIDNYNRGYFIRIDNVVSIASLYGGLIIYTI